MYACTHVCMYACTHVCTARMYVCMHACMYACTHVCMYEFVKPNACACAPVCLCVCVCVRVRVCVCVCLYISPRNSKPTSFICNICVFLFCKREISELPLTRRPIHQKATHLCKSRTSRRHADTLPPTHSQAFFLALSLFALGSSRAGRA